MLTFDHLIIFSFDPKKHQELFSAVHQLKGGPGGKHDNWGTYNHLAFMNNSYIEWIGIDDLEKASESDNPLIKHVYHASKNRSEGVIQFAFSVDNIEAYRNEFESKNIPYTGPFSGSRTKPDGSLLEWKMLFPQYDVEGAPLPFLLEWSGEGNKPTNLEDINQVDFEEISVFVENVKDYKDRFEHIYNIKPTNSSDDKCEWELSNGKLTVTQGEGLVARFGHIKFKSHK